METIGDAGYNVLIGAAGGCPVVEAMSQETGERFIVRSENLYDAAVELAEQLGFDLRDG